MDPLFRVDVLARTEHPQTVCWWAAHQDYSEKFVFDAHPPTESDAGRIVVKRLLAGNRGHYGCYSADTSVMTARGWVDWPDVLHSDKLLAVDPQTGEGQFELPTHLICQSVSRGDYLYAVTSNRLDMRVTHDHRMVISTRRKSGKWSEWRFASALEVMGKAVRYRTVSELSEHQRALPIDLPQGCSAMDALRLAGFYFGDGVRSQSIHPTCLRFRLQRPRKIAYLTDVGGRVGVLEPKAEKRYTLYCGELADWVEQHFRGPEGKRVPLWLLQLPRAHFLAFLDGLRHSDGTRFKATARNGEPSWALDCSEKNALELIQAAAALNGISSNMYLNHPNVGPEHINHRPCWRLAFTHSNPYLRFELNHGRTYGTEAAIPYTGNVYCATVSTGALLVRRNGKPVVSGNCLEHPSITFNAGWFPHSVMQQARTHRVGVSFDVQSGRYTGKRVIAVTTGKLDLDQVFYLRPVGTYTDRQGKSYEYTSTQRNIDRLFCTYAANRYNLAISQGLSEEHARDFLPYAIRQHFVVSFNLRSLMHFLDLRSKKDAQLEIQQMCNLIWPHFEQWAPEIASWYATNRLHKARLSP